MINLFRRRYLISLTYLLVVLIGIIAWRDIAMERTPELNLPSISISYSWGTTTPEVMEQEITRKVEQAANRLRDVQQIESISREGQSTVTVTFSKHAPVDYRVVELQEYLVGLREALPSNVGSPSISRRKPRELQDQENFLTYSISGDRNVRDLLELTRQKIRLPLLGLEGLDDIEIDGARDPALTIEFDTDLVEKLGIFPNRVLGEISSNMRWRSSGYFESGGKRVSMLVPPQFEDIQEIRNLKIRLRNSSRIIRLAEIADVSIQDYPTRSLTRINGSPALSFRFLKESGADALGLAEEIRTRIGEIQLTLPPDIHIQLEQDVTEELRAQFGSLQFQALISLLVVFLVLLLFIRRFRAPFVILGSIIFSILMSVAALYLIGYTLNIITLAGLTVALGMIIDNAVVVFEQVNPGLPEGRDERLEHIKKYLPRSLVPVFGSTLTTVGIFLPLFFALEELQIFLVPLAVALTFTLVSSLIISLTWIPYALIWLVPSSRESDRALHDSIRARTKKYFSNLVHRPLMLLFVWRGKLRWLLYAGLIATFGIPLFAIEEPDWEEDTWWPEFTQTYFHNRTDIDPWIGGLTYRFFNDTYFGQPWGGYNRQQTIRINIRTPQGTPLDEIDKMAHNYERIAKPYDDAFTYYETHVNTGGGNSSATLTFYVKNDYLYRPEPYIFYFEAQYLAAGTGNSGISVYGLGLDGISTSFGSYTSGQRIYLTGYNYDQLLDLARDLERRLKRNRRVQEVDIHGSGYSRGELYQYLLKLKDDEMALRGLDRSRLLNALSLDMNPLNLRGRIELDGQSMYLVSRNKSRITYEEELFREIRSVDSVTFTLDEVAELTRQKAMPSIRRENQSYFRTVTVDFLGPYRLANNYISSVVEETPVPVGSKIEYGSGGIFGFGNDENVQNMMLLLGLTLLCVWMIVSALLESWLDPLVVILAVPLSLIGIMAGTLYHDLAFDRGAMAGTLLCVGVVVNNSILLIYEKQRFRGLGIHGIRSWLNVYKNKMRAVLITTLTTIGGLIPMIVIGDSEFWQTLATIVVWGLGGSTLLILLLMGVWEKKLTISPK